MQAAYDVKLGDGFRPAFASAMPNFFERPSISFGILCALSESTQLAARYANIGRIDVPVYIEPSYVAVHPLTDQVRHVADREDIRGTVERHAVFERQARAGAHLVQDRQ